MHESEVARLLAQIDAEYEAAERGLTGLALGTTQHAFVTARTEHTCQLHKELWTLVGNDVMTLVSQPLDKFSEEQL
jgi:hypothetical protein